MKTTAIDSPDFLITSDRDETVEGFAAWTNKKLEFLPTNLGEKFPNLIVLSAQNSAIKKITKKSFKGLGRLRKLYLHDNQIEAVDDDAFEFVPAVEEINLREYLSSVCFCHA